MSFMRTLHLGAAGALITCLIISTDSYAQKKKKRGETVKEAKQELTKSEAVLIEEQKVEIEIGRGMAGRLLTFYGKYEDEELLGYINQIGNYVAGYSDAPDRRYMFEILDSDIVNAFAAPGGYILITKGAIKHARDEAELAAVLSHEMVHVNRRHVLDTLKQMTRDELDDTAKEMEAKIKIPRALEVRKRPVVDESDAAGALLARYLSGSAAGLSVMAAAKAGMSMLLEKGLKPEFEFEADGEGVRDAVRSGYHPDALVQYLCRLELKKQNINISKDKKCELKAVKKSGKDDEKSILDKTHPPIMARIKHINKVLVTLEAENIVGAKGKKRFDHFTGKIPDPKPIKTGKK